MTNNTSNAYARTNRMTHLRMRDSKRFVLIYRKAAWDAAIEHAQKQSFLSMMIAAISHMAHLMSHDRSA